MNDTIKKQLIFLALSSLLMILLFSAACKTPWSRSEQLNPEFKRIDMDLKNTFPVNFLEGFAVLGKIDLYYGANLKKEYIGGPIVKQNKIDSMIMDIQDFRAAVDPEDRDARDIIKIRDIEKTDMDFVALLIDARIKMLEAEKSIHLAYSFGGQGLAGDGYFCREKDTIYLSLDHFEDAIKKARDAERYMDIVLTGNPADEKLTRLIRDVLGVGKEKIPFYTSPLGEMQLQIGKELLSADAQRYLAEELLEIAKSRKAIVIPLQTENPES